MIPNYLRIRGTTKENRYKIIDYVVSSINKCSGYVTNHTTFSNAIIVINFEIELIGVTNLLNLLNSNGITLLDESIEVRDHFLKNIDEEEFKDKEIMGSIQISFFHE
ncbi:hypothetical protein [Gottfriedia luciferensis]|uniref:hypothetical protein n=1 Tax=Gottfriedia luciferensis TaxID=178774 RepID=UPI000B452CA2|nr:hypothetical protein [Gottfriedia luciferensis]